ncbi:helix-turn-helix domain-containing protein [Asticcacaulis machinosus]|uniref:Helix-turn-helix transcriptional regulator n=1 Tax=Asticcacaulis machinosus TaxID=2984211 RepID=A0ABT5HGS1_9CAUL|nr:helix-turn-helix transcriptional regulator [Asticcacaulis machinosus]MDC7675188.1 helix-turn-helix transcriptional regulator [Asticcacaulis machinosus]
MSEMELYKVVGAAVAAQRKKLNLTQAEVAKEIGLTRASLANIETGRQKFMLHHIYKLANALSLSSISELVPPAFLFSAEPDNIQLSGSSINDVQLAQVNQFLRSMGRSS